MREGHSGSACFTGTFNSIVSSLYTFEEFSFSQRADKDIVREEFASELRKKGEELFNQLSNDKEKKKVAEALTAASFSSNDKEQEEDARASSSDPATNFCSSYIESFKNHSARAVLGDKECDKLVKAHLSNLQYNETISGYLP